MRNSRKRGFTFIEILITLAVIAICFLPLIRMFSVSLEQVGISADLTTARYLAQEGMEKIKNLGFTEFQIRHLGSMWQPPLDKPPLELNGNKWRTLSKSVAGTDPLEIHIEVYQMSDYGDGRTKEVLFAKLVTLVEDLDWTPVE